MERKLVRVQEKGQVTLPSAVRRKLGLKKGDWVAIVETADGILIAPQEVLALKTLDRIGEALKTRGLSLEDFVESGREVRGELIKEQHGIDSNGKTGLHSG